MKRITQRRPGYDNRYGPDAVPDGGISGGSYYWGFLADEGDLALVLQLHADEYPDTIPEDVRSRLGHRDDFHRAHPLGSLTVHANAPVGRDQVLTSPHAYCEFLGGDCYDGWTSSLATERFADVLTRDVGGCILFDQPEAFWTRLAEQAEKLFPRVRADMVETAQWARCPTCNGRQTVGVGRVGVASWCPRCKGIVIGKHTPKRRCDTCDSLLFPVHVGFQAEG